MFKFLNYFTQNFLIILLKVVLLPIYHIIATKHLVHKVKFHVFDYFSFLLTVSSTSILAFQFELCHLRLSFSTLYPFKFVNHLEIQLNQIPYLIYSISLENRPMSLNSQINQTFQTKYILTNSFKSKHSYIFEKHLPLLYRITCLLLRFDRLVFCIQL